MFFFIYIYDKNNKKFKPTQCRLEKHVYLHRQGKKLVLFSLSKKSPKKSTKTDFLRFFVKKNDIKKRTMQDKKKISVTFFFLDNVEILVKKWTFSKIFFQFFQKWTFLKMSTFRFFKIKLGKISHFLTRIKITYIQ